MRFVIITQNAPPRLCGISDHSLQLAAALRAAGHATNVLARDGAPDEELQIVSGPISEEWLAELEDRLERAGADHLILQYTPLMFSKGDNWRVERALLRCWRSLRETRRASLIVHETYFRAWWYPPSLLRGSLQKSFLKQLARASDDVFTASQPLREEMSTWRLARDPILLPIGSNIPVTERDGTSLRQRYGIAEEDVVLTLFGGGNNLKWNARHIDALEATLVGAGVPHCWLLLGGTSPNWFRLSTPVCSPGRLTLADLSEHLQLTDIFLVPHILGLSAKRGTVMAALEHALPIVGTSGPMTDSFWSGVPGVTLVDGASVNEFTTAVLQLCRDRERRRCDGRRNAEYHRAHFAWSLIADRLLSSIR